MGNKIVQNRDDHYYADDMIFGQQIVQNWDDYDYTDQPFVITFLVLASKMGSFKQRHFSQREGDNADCIRF